MSADNRTAHTDAVATLGTILDNTAKRDAIHLATEPVIADQKLYPGQDVGIDSQGRGSTMNVKLVGIVDPFLKAPVMPGERFWLIVYPRQISTLRHIWSHPDFPEPTSAPVTAPVITQEPVASAVLATAIRYITGIAEDVDDTYSSVMRTASENEGADELFTESNRYIWPDDIFWEHYSTITGKDVELSSYDDGCRGC